MSEKTSNAQPAPAQPTGGTSSSWTTMDNPYTRSSAQPSSSPSGKASKGSK